MILVLKNSQSHFKLIDSFLFLLLSASAMQNRPMSSKGAIGLQTPVQVADRPITQQGLSGIRAGATGTR